MSTYKYLGNFSAAPPDRSVVLSCPPCEVSWTGCADAFECPICGRPQDPAAEFVDDDPTLVFEGDEPTSPGTVGDFSAVLAEAMKLYDSGRCQTLGDAFEALGLDLDRALALRAWETSKRLDGAPGAR